MKLRIKSRKIRTLQGNKIDFLLGLRLQGVRGGLWGQDAGRHADGWPGILGKGWFISSSWREQEQTDV